MDKETRHIFILNPIAGKGKTTGLIPVIKELCETGGLEYNIEITSYPGHAVEIAKSHSMKQNRRLYSVGGDGTLNEVLNGMADSGSALACIPAGTGNDFIKTIIGMDIPKNIIEATIKGTERPIDYATVNGKYFINIASVGFDAEVAYQAGHFKKLPLLSGEMAYILGILVSLIRCENHHMDILVDGVNTKGKILLAAIGNGRYYGGGFRALPDADITDGLLDICHVDKMRRLEILGLFPKYKKGLHASIKGVHLCRGKKVEIKADKPIPLNLDGEIYLYQDVVFEVFPKGLPFVFPAV